MAYVTFFVSAIVVVFTAIRLTVFADKLSDKLNLGKAFIGIVLLGFVTSLPEAVSSFVAIVSLNAPDLAVGNLLGSNNFNPILVVVMDFFHRRGALTNDIHPLRSHKVSSWLSIVLVLLVIGEIYLLQFSFWPRWNVITPGTILIVLVYFFGMKYLAQLSQGVADRPTVAIDTDESLSTIIINLIICSIIVIIAAIGLAYSADIIAQQTGLGGTFFGSIFLAFITSLPEMVVVLSAMKLASLDLAIGNIFGSNMSNMLILVFCSFFSKEGALLSQVSMTHIVTGSLSILLTFIVLMGIHFRNKKSMLGLGFDSIIMLVLFLVGTGILYQLR